MRKRSIKTISFYNLLNGDLEQDNTLSDDYKIVLVDDRVIANKGDFKKAFSAINQLFPSCIKIVFKNLMIDTYPELVNIVKEEIIPNVSVLNLRKSNTTIYRMNNTDPLVPVSFFANPEDIFSLDREDFGAINNNVTYDRNILDDKSFIRGLDSIINQINFMAKNDIQKILLLDKMFRENVRYDYTYLKLTDSEKQNDVCGKCHKAQSVLRDRLAVCDGFSSFAAFILNKVGIECKVVSGMYDNEGHAWNIVKLDNKWYHCDFTFSFTGDLKKTLKYILVDNPTDRHTLKNHKKAILNTFDRDTLIKESDSIKSLKVLMPTYHKADGSMYHIRRPAITIEEFEVKYDNEAKRVRRPANIIPQKRQRRLAKIIDKKD